MMCRGGGEGDGGPHFSLGRYGAGLSPAKGPYVAKAATFEAPFLVVVCEHLNNTIKYAVGGVHRDEVGELSALVDRHFDVQNAVIGVWKKWVAPDAALRKNNNSKSCHEFFK